MGLDAHQQVDLTPRHLRLPLDIPPMGALNHDRQTRINSLNQLVKIKLAIFIRLNRS